MRKKFVLLVIAVLLFSTLIQAAGAPDFYNYGNALYKKSDYKKALVYYTQAAKLDKRNPAYYSAIASCYDKLGNAPMAKKFNSYSQALSKNGGSSGSTNVGNKIKVTAFAGFTTAGMTQVNVIIDTIAAAGTASGETVTTQNLGGGFLIGAQAGYSVIKGLYVGPRLEFASIFAGKTTASIDTPAMPPYYPAMHEETVYTFGASITDILLGASYYYTLSGQPFVFSGDLYLGYGLAGGNINYEYSYYGTSEKTEIPLEGGTFVTVISASADYKMSDMISAGLTLGYRIANVPKMSVAKDVVQNGGTIPKGYYITSSSFISNTGAATSYDFSGFIISLNGNISF